MSETTQPVIGAQVTMVPPTAEQEKLCPFPPSPLMPSPAVTEQSLRSEETTPDFDPSVGAKPYSPFYCHDTPSVEKLKNEARISGRGYTSQDLESCLRSPIKHSIEIQNARRSKLWEPKRRHCDCLSALSPAQRLAVKLLIAFIILGTMVGIALGITAAVGGAVWRSNNRQTPIGG
ncbi:hypothetical protein VTN77DRAFT_6805 [Rasamsonia byssochlamydoides]|uniref:uncharacterized protein n=1 Tax=Rasamsonia byssochlamydoides TaxID=89139 RepID=UPI003741ED65